jgi:RNA polymerase sigma-70 factor (ECF subfamily)
VTFETANFERMNFGHDRPNLEGLVVAAQSGRPTAFQELIRSYELPVLRVALNVTGSESAAQDIYCAVFRDAYVAVHQLREGDSLYVWFYRILVRHCLEYCRRNSLVNGSDRFSGNFGQRLNRAILKLTPTEQVVFELKQHQGLKIETLAKIFNATPEFIVKILENAITHLRRGARMLPNSNE